MPIRERYKIIKELGDRASKAEGLSFTYLACENLDFPAYEQNLEVPKFVIKAINLLQCTEKLKELFVREINILEFLNRAAQDQKRPLNVPKLRASSQEDFWFAYDYMDGTSLEEELPIGKPMPEPQVIALLQEILELVTWVHDNRIIHRDIKPANMIRANVSQSLILIDFGAATPIKPDLGEDQFSTVIGTFGYQDPLQEASKPSNFQNDLYSIGVIGIQALTGKRPDKDMPLMNFQKQSLWQQFAPQTSEKLIHVLNRMIHTDHLTRYANTREVLKDLGLPVPEPLADSDLVCRHYPKLYPELSPEFSPAAALPIHPKLNPLPTRAPDPQRPPQIRPVLDAPPVKEPSPSRAWMPLLFGTLGVCVLVGLGLFLTRPQTQQNPNVPAFTPAPPRSNN